MVSSTRSLSEGLIATSVLMYIAYSTPSTMSPPKGSSRLAIAPIASAATITLSGWFLFRSILVMMLLITPKNAPIAKSAPTVSTLYPFSMSSSGMVMSRIAQ